MKSAVAVAVAAVAAAAATVADEPVVASPCARALLRRCEFEVGCL